MTVISRNNVAAILGADTEAVQQLFAALVAKWRANGVNVVGVISEPLGSAEHDCGAGVLRNIVSGNIYKMSFDQPPAGTSCSLDADGVTAACKGLMDQLKGSDLVVLSKFGKLEAMNQGLAEAFAAAISEDKPVLTCVSQKHFSAWRTFAPNAISLEPTKIALQAWYDDVAPAPEVSMGA